MIEIWVYAYVVEAWVLLLYRMMTLEEGNAKMVVKKKVLFDRGR